MKNKADLAMNEARFVRELERKVKEQRKIVETEMLPSWARGVGEWLVVHPWRVIIPMALLVYLAIRMTYGERVSELVLAVFGGY